MGSRGLACGNAQTVESLTSTFENALYRRPLLAHT
jgi:hypothetical protein